MNQMANSIINERAQHLLKMLVERYIRDGQPVGSRTLALETSLGLSSATIRSILADLEEGGYLISPHTSAGRIPTARGYRFFVDSLLTIAPLDEMTTEQFRQQLRPDLDSGGLVAVASNLLSELTRLAGLVMLPRHEQLTLRHIEFLPLTGNRILVVLVLNEQEVQNRIIYTNRAYTASELEQAANYLNSIYIGQDIQVIRDRLLADLQDDRASASCLMQATVDVVDKVFNESQATNDYVLAGQNYLLDLADATDMTRLRQLFAAVTQKQAVLHLLDQCLNTEGVQIFIGQEAGYEIFDACSLITAPYSVEGQVLGVLGVIGPTRIPYQRIIPIVDMTAKLLSAALNQGK